MKKQVMELKQGWKINMDTGACEQAQEEAATRLFYRVYPGTTLVCEQEDCVYDMAVYSLKQPDKYIYSYDYQPEEQWTTLVNKKESIAGKNKEKIVFGQDRYIRLSVRGTGQTKEGETSMPPTEGFYLEHPEDELDKDRTRKEFLDRQDVKEEIEKTVSSIQAKRSEDCLVFTLLADTHYVANGNWENTAAAVRSVNSRITPDGVIHLGDFTDGMLDKEMCIAYSSRVLDEMKSWGYPLYLTIGNHDVNYFHNNPEVLSPREQYDCYLKDTVTGKVEPGQLWYSNDWEKQKLRLLFLSSFDPEEINRYGFPEEEIRWVEEQLTTLPQEYKVLLFAHDAPIARLDYWAKEIRNGEKLMSLLEYWHKTNEGRIIAYIHGHTHADYIYHDREFPVISVGSSKCEYFTSKKPEGAVCYWRQPGTVDELLWDTLIVHPATNELDFVRFGAGIDRHAGPGREGKTLVWAHRGASGYAPENTLEAFQLAIDMGADGIELDVQFTKDREVVVLHDETIDRTSTGHGYVEDHTLEQLKKLTFNKTHPEYTQAAIPTLREVLALVKPTNLVINIELKTGINFYSGIEEAVIALVEEAGMEDRIIYSSFNHETIRRISQLRPEAKTGLLYCDGIYDITAYAGDFVGKDSRIDAIHPALYNMQYPGLIEKCREKNLRIHVWTVNRREDMERMCEMGVDAMITNYPDVALEVVTGRKSAVPGQSAPEQAGAAAGAANHGSNKNPLLHAAGVAYSKVRKVFVAIDNKVQKAAGR